MRDLRGQALEDLADDEQCRPFEPAPADGGHLARDLDLVIVIDARARTLGGEPHPAGALRRTERSVEPAGDGRRCRRGHVGECDIGDETPAHRADAEADLGAIGVVADLVERYGDDGSMVPAALSDYIKAREGYDYDHHGKAGNPSTDFVPDEVIDRFCVLGTIDDHIARMEELRDIGVDQFSIYLMHDQKDETLNAYGQRVIPAMAGG